MRDHEAAGHRLLVIAGATKKPGTNTACGMFPPTFNLLNLK
jgi:hypothetical protein